MYLRKNGAIFIKTAHEEQMHFVFPEPYLWVKRMLMERLYMIFNSRSLILENTHDGNEIILEPDTNVWAMQSHNFVLVF